MKAWSSTVQDAAMGCVNIDVLAAALRVLTDIASSRKVAPSDFDLVLRNALVGERDLDLETMAVQVARRAMMQQQAVRRQFGCDTVTS